MLIVNLVIDLNW